jgi:hypothetical protein
MLLLLIIAGGDGEMSVGFLDHDFPPCSDANCSGEKDDESSEFGQLNLYSLDDGNDVFWGVLVMLSAEE